MAQHRPQNGSRGSRRPQFGDTIALTRGPPPPYTSGYWGKPPVLPPQRSRYDPRSWSRRTWIIAGVVVIVLIIIIVVAVVVSGRNSYPNYSELNYNLVETISGASFFDSFDYFTADDPSSGFVHYVDSVTAAALNLTYATATSAVLRVDNSDIDTSLGRRSVRINTKSTYNTGLFIFDVIHSPVGCSTWPALWLTDYVHWPANGEIDVIEATNAAITGNQITLHTSNDCTMSNVKRKQEGSVLANNCYNGTNNNIGCAVEGSPPTIGPTFNSNGGGVYAMELRDAGIRTWFFDRTSIPSDISASSTNTSTSTSSSTPDPSTWGEPLADFPSTRCDISSHFRNQSIIANIDLCGNWAGLSEYFNTQSGCPGTCVDYVKQQPGSVFDDAYWEFGAFHVYQAS